MKKVQCDLFKEGQQMYFDIMRLATLEKLWGKPIAQAISNLGISELLSAFVIGLSHEWPSYAKKEQPWYAKRIQELIDGGMSLSDITSPVLHAIIGSGILGKEAYFAIFPDEMTEDDRKDIELEAEEAEKNE